VELDWRGPVSQFMLDDTPEIDIEGALSSGKTTVCLWKCFNYTQAYPGIHGYIGRYGDGETQTKVRPAWEAVLRQGGQEANWNAKENSYDFLNGSRVYAFGLKSPDERSRYSKIRGMGVSFIYVDQTEELPEDMGLELRGRLRQPGFPHRLIFSPNPQNVTHWLASQFPEDNSINGRKYYAVSLYDNAHHLPPDFIETQERTYPPEHAKYRSVVLGKRGVNVTGDPVYRGAFVRRLHTAPNLYNPAQVLLESIDFGKKHPCIVWAQETYTGGIRVLGGLLGQNLFLDDFLQTAVQTRQEWFPDEIGRQTCCDPAGSHQNSQGTRFNGVDLLRKAGFAPVWKDNSNAPDVRLACIESLSAHMRRREPSGLEAFLVESDPLKWQRVSVEGMTADGFLTDALEAGYVWDVHDVSVGNKQVRKAKKDGWFEHGMNALEYIELNFGALRATQAEQAKSLARRRINQARMPRIMPGELWG
jgi:hypothetical protein